MRKESFYALCRGQDLEGDTEHRPGQWKEMEPRGLVRPRGGIALAKAMGVRERGLEGQGWE